VPRALHFYAFYDIMNMSCCGEISAKHKRIDGAESGSTVHFLKSGPIDHYIAGITIYDMTLSIRLLVYSMPGVDSCI
jgi:hypothetical protein